jgi:hypothetical protein
MDDYKSKQIQNEREMQKLYKEEWKNLTPAQREVVFKQDEFNSFEINAGGKPIKMRKQKSKQQSTEIAHGLSIVGTNGKQEPNARTLKFDDNGKPEIGDTPNEVKLDSREDQVRQCILYKGDLPNLIKQFVFEDLSKYQNELIKNFARLIIDSKNPKLELQSIIKGAGVEFEDAENGERLAKEYGITRQAISRKTNNKKDQLGLPDDTRDSKAATSRDTYKKTNHRNTNI